MAKTTYLLDARSEKIKIRNKVKYNLLGHIQESRVKKLKPRSNQLLLDNGLVVKARHCQVLKRNRTDVYIKDEGYADFRLATQKAKLWANRNGYTNSLLSQFGKGNTFCGEQIWDDENKSGAYSFAMNNTPKLYRTIEKMKKAGLKVESEF